MNDYKNGGAMNQGQRVRYLKTGGIIAFILCLLYFFVPRDGVSGGSYLIYHAHGNGCFLAASNSWGCNAI